MYHEIYTCLQVKCVQYWPDAVGRSQTYGPFSICLTEEQELADYVVRTIELKVRVTIHFILGVASIVHIYQCLQNTELGNRLHVVTQYHFTAWPDHGVPEYATAILAFRQRLLSTHDASTGPMLVHCR